MLKLLIGRSGCGKSAAVLQRICREGEERPQVLLVPEQASHEAERRLCTAGGSKTSLYAEVLSFTRLSNRVLSACGGLAAPTLDAGGRILLLQMALRAVEGQLKVYARPSRKPAFLSGLLATLDELKSCCISPRALEEAAGELDGLEGDKLQDLALLLGAYDALTAQGPLDPRDRLTRLAQKLTESRWAEGMDFYLDGFLDFTPQERGVIQALLKQAHSVTVTLTCDQLQEYQEGMGIFSTARRTAAQLLRMAEEVRRPVQVEQLEMGAQVRSPALAYLEAHLFGEGALPPAPPAEGIGLFQAWSPRSEVEWTAARILELVRTQGYRFREIGVAARSFEGYGDLVESIFQRYGIPVFTSVMTDILQKPVLAVVSAALDTVSGNYAYEDMFRYLKTGLTDLPQEDVDLLENYVLKWDLRGSRWTAPADWTMHPSGYGMQLEEEDRVLLARLNAARRKVVRPLEQLRKNTNRTGEGQAKALYRFLEEIQLPQTLEERTEELRRRGELTLAAEYAQLWEILCRGMEQCAALLGETPMELEEFARLFQLVLSQYDVGAIPVSLDRVTAGEAPRMVNRELKVLFLLGADDGSLPQVAAAPGLLTDEDRSLLSSFGLELAPRTEERLYREMTIVYGACAQPTQALFVSWPKAGGGGEEKRPSFLVERLRRLFPDLKVQEEGALAGSFRRQALRPALEQAGRSPALRAALREIPGCTPLVERLERAACWERGRLSRGGVRALYGDRVPMSASRMDKYKACHFSYFMEYGLKARPRKPAGFQAPEYGTFVHYVLEHVFQESKSPTRQQIKAVVERYVTEELGGLEGESPRFQYLFQRLLKSVYLVVENVAQELAASQFTPLSFELGFGARGELPPVEVQAGGVTISISGFVDRVDGWVKDDKLYLRVVDYKTGRKSFDLTEVWNGMGLQMLLYLFTLREKGKTLYGKEVVPAGVLYLPARDAILSGSRNMTEEERRRKVDAELRRKGLVLDDPEVLAAMERPGEDGIRFLPLRLTKGGLTGEALVSAQRLGRLKGHIDRVLDGICEELAAGNIAADPFWRGPEKNACRYCDYAAACHFEEGLGEDRRRWLPTVKGEEFWRSVEEETGPA
jgi:ATP-dependent helicase/nuclease subunit B